MLHHELEDSDVFLDNEISPKYSNHGWLKIGLDALNMA